MNSFQQKVIANRIQTAVSGSNPLGDIKKHVHKVFTWIIWYILQQKTNMNGCEANYECEHVRCDDSGYGFPFHFVPALDMLKGSDQDVDGLCGAKYDDEHWNKIT